MFVDHLKTGGAATPTLRHCNHNESLGARAGVFTRFHEHGASRVKFF